MTTTTRPADLAAAIDRARPGTQTWISGALTMLAHRIALDPTASRGDVTTIPLPGGAVLRVWVAVVLPREETRR